MSATTGIVITILLLLVNAFFVAGEFAVTSSRRAQIEPLVEAGERGAAKALWAIEHVSLMLSICQLGITVASTSLGAVAEPAIASLVEHPLVSWGLPAASAHIVGFAVALGLVLYLHIVFGEMVPKNLSVSMPDRALLWLAPPLVAIGRVFRHVINFMDRVANWFVRLLGFEPKSEVSSTFTVEEVATIVELSTAQGTLHDDLGLLSGTLEFSEESVANTMVPLEKLVVLPESVTPAEVEKEVARTGFSRYPVVSASAAVDFPEGAQLVGYLHIKDVLYASDKERDLPIPSWRIRDLPQVEGAAEVEDALREMQRLGTHLAEVYEDGKPVGVLFLEDILEELVGEVHDALQRDQLP